jgi:hypothetical protein
MEWRSTLLLVPFALVGTIAGAQSLMEATLPDVNALVRKAILRQRFAESKVQEYIFREDTDDIRLRKECTWAPSVMSH